MSTSLDAQSHVLTRGTPRTNVGVVKSSSLNDDRNGPLSPQGSPVGCLYGTKTGPSNALPVGSTAQHPCRGSGGDASGTLLVEEGLGGTSAARAPHRYRPSADHSERRRSVGHLPTVARPGSADGARGDDRRPAARAFPRLGSCWFAR